jgi:hypothetical protein
MRKRQHPEIIYTTKVCSKCGIEKPLSAFSKAKRERRGVVPACKECHSCLTPEQKQKNQEALDLFNRGFKQCTKCGEIKELKKFGSKRSKKGGLYNYKSFCRDCGNAIVREFKKTDKYKEYTRIYRQLHLDKMREDANNRNKKNRKHLSEKKKQNELNNPSMKIAATLRSRIWAVLVRMGMGCKKWFGFWDVVGCSPAELKAHLESQFKEGMTWETHGRRGWHIDHILPCASFDLNNPEEQRICFHYKNLQPLWWYENISKSDKIVA